MSQQQKEERETRTGSEREQIAGDILWPQLAHKKQRHAGDARGDGDEVTRAKLLFVKERLENQNVNGGRVLKKDCVGGGRQFGGEHEKNQQRRVENRSDRANWIDAKAFLARENCDGDCGE